MLRFQVLEGNLDVGTIDYFPQMRGIPILPVPLLLKVAWELIIEYS